MSGTCPLSPPLRASHWQRSQPGERGTKSGRAKYTAMFSGMQLNDSQPGASPAAATQADARAEAGGLPAPPLTTAGGSSFSFMNGGAADAAPSMSSGLAALGGMPGAAASPFAFMSQPEPSLAPAAPACTPAAPGPACGALASLAAAGKTPPVVRKKTSKARKPGWAADGTVQDGTAPPDGAVPPMAPSPTPAAAAAPPRSGLQLEHRTSGELHGLAPGLDERAPPRRGVGCGGEGGGGSCGSGGLDAGGGFAGFAPPAPSPGALPGAPAGASPGERLRAMLGDDFIGLTGTPTSAGGSAYGTRG